MFRIFNICMLPALYASPGNTIYDEILRTSSWGHRRRTNSLVPAYSIYEAESFTEQAVIEDPPAPPKRPIPTDVPVKEPTDIPLRDPREVPPPPGSEKPIAPPTKEPQDVPVNDPKPRPIP